MSTSPPIISTPPTNDTHRKTVGYVLWIFGFTGSHRFYYGKPISGTIWLFTLGLLGLGWFIDLFLIPGMDRQADRRFVAGRVDYSVAWILQTFLGPLGLHRLYIPARVWKDLHCELGDLLVGRIETDSEPAKP